MINALILGLAGVLASTRLSAVRILLSASIGAGFSVAYIYITGYAVLLKIATAGLMLAVAKKYKSIREFLRFLLIFLAVTFALAGAVVMLNYINYDVTERLDFNTATPATLFGGIILGYILVRHLGGLLQRKKRVTQFIYECVVNGEHVKAYYDTGNKLVTEDGESVQVISKRLADRLGMTGDSVSPLQKNKTLAVATVSGVLSMKVVDLSIDIYFNKREHKVVQTKAVVSDAFNQRDYDIILNRDSEVLHYEPTKKGDKTDCGFFPRASVKGKDVSKKAV